MRISRRLVILKAIKTVFQVFRILRKVSNVLILTNNVSFSNEVLSVVYKLIKFCSALLRN